MIETNTDCCSYYCDGDSDNCKDTIHIGDKYSYFATRTICFECIKAEHQRVVDAEE